MIYTMVPFGNAAMFVLGFPLGFFASGVFSAMGPFFTEHFPTRVRGVGQGFAYNFGRATGALFPTLVGVLSATMPLGQAVDDALRQIARGRVVAMPLRVVAEPEGAG